MTVRNFLDMSTVHVKPRTCADLTLLGKSTLLIGTNGFMLWIPGRKPEPDELDQYPPEICEAFKIARAKYPDVEYLSFDSDAPVNPDFPTYAGEWE